MRNITPLINGKSIKQLVSTFFVFVVSVGIFFSCKKEVDCEHCTGVDIPPPIIDTDNKNHSPVADAGSDQVIYLPANTVVLDGSGSSDPDNNITSYTWNFITGPMVYLPEDEFAVKTEPFKLGVEGIYQYYLQVTDSAGLSDRDTIEIVLLKQRVGCTDCRIVFESDRDGNLDIYSCRDDGSDIRRLTNDPGRDEDPVWSPDGNHIAFISDRFGSPQLCIMNADGSNVVRRTLSATEPSDPAWSPDGSKIAYTNNGGGDSNIWLVGALTNESPTLLFEAPGYDAQPAWSPDGNRIVIVSDWAAYDFVYDVYLINAGGTQFKPITGNIFDHEDYLYPSWSPDATKLAMIILKRSDDNASEYQIGVMNPDGSNLLVVSEEGGEWPKTSWSADGKRIAFTTYTGSRFDVSWVSSDGSKHGTIVTNGWNADWQH